ncbi:GNAT superfamily N-acetyltransferase [Rubrivivax gelatinosus]|nr:GNAT superfamily N-acetyltransferase [Rubrivivax gelatinosus]
MTTSVLVQPPDPEELAGLFNAVGWGQNDPSIVGQSIDAYPFTACARTEGGKLIGYLSAFSDGVMSTLLGELVVHPEWRRQGVARSLLTALERRYPSAPIYIKALGDSRHFYEAIGFKVPKAEFTVMFKRPSATFT